MLAKIISIHALLAESDLKAFSSIVDVFAISIHALLAESDIKIRFLFRLLKISIHALLAESDFKLFPERFCNPLISIHALLAESDGNALKIGPKARKFLSTLSLRRATVEKVPADVFYQAFLSTLSLRRATLILPPDETSSVISIHALLAESDCMGRY